MHNGNIYLRSGGTLYKFKFDKLEKVLEYDRLFASNVGDRLIVARYDW